MMQYTLLTSAAKSVVAWHMFYTASTYGYIIYSSFNLEDLKTRWERNGNLTCYQNPAGLKLNLYPVFAILEVQLLRAAYELFPYRFLALSHDKLAYPMAFSVPLFAISYTTFIFMKKETLCSLGPEMLLLFKLNLDFSNTSTYLVKNNFDNIVYLMIVIIEAIIRLCKKKKKWRSHNKVGVLNIQRNQTSRKAWAEPNSHHVETETTRKVENVGQISNNTAQSKHKKDEKETVRGVGIKVGISDNKKKKPNNKENERKTIREVDNVVQISNDTEQSKNNNTANETARGVNLEISNDIEKHEDKENEREMAREAEIVVQNSNDIEQSKNNTTENETSMEVGMVVTNYSDQLNNNTENETSMEVGMVVTNYSDQLNNNTENEISMEVGMVVPNYSDQLNNNKNDQTTQIAAKNMKESIIGPFVPMLFIGLFHWIIHKFIVQYYLPSVYTDCILLGLPFYWIISSEEIKDHFKHKIRQFKIKFGYF